MGKGDIRTRRGKIWRRTYGVSRPRRYKTAVRPAASTRKVKTMQDIPQVVAETMVKKPVTEEIQNNAEVAATETTPTEASAKKPAAKKAPVAKKPSAKKTTEKKD